MDSSASVGLSMALESDRADMRRQRNAGTKLMLAKYHVEQALKAGVTPVVYKELIELLKLIEAIELSNQ